MNAIKLPVQAIDPYGTWLFSWKVTDSDGVTVCDCGKSGQSAKQISLALNSHDALVEALELYATNRIPDEMPCGDIARAALAKVGKLRKNQ